MPTPILQLNDRGNEVKKLQGQLEKLGYQIPLLESNTKTFGEGTRKALLQLQKKLGHRLPKGVLDVATEARITTAAKSTEKDKLFIEGHLLFDNGNLAEGVEIEFVQKAFGGTEKVLGKATTQADGSYKLPVDINAAAENINFFVRTKNQQGEYVDLTSTRFNADEHEVVNMVVPLAIQAAKDEYTRLTAAVKPYLNGKGLASAQENNQQGDLTLLTQASRWDARLLAFAAKAEQLTGTGMVKAARYALIRAGLPAEVEQLANVAPATVKKALTKAKEAGIANFNVATAVRKFEQFHQKKRLEQVSVGTLSTAGELTAQVLDEADKTKFEKFYLQHSTDDPEFWSKAKAAEVSTKGIKQLQLQGKLSYLTLNNAKLVEQLQPAINGDETEAVIKQKLANQLIGKKLYNEKAWQEQINQLAGGDESQVTKLIPAVYLGADDPLEAYAADMARKVRMTFPTQIVSAKIANDEIKIGDNHSSIKQPLQKVLQQAEQLGYQLGQQSFPKLLKEKRNELLQGVAVDKVEATLDATKQLHRLYQMTPSDDALEVMCGLGLKSAYDVTAYTQDEFLRYYGKYFPSPREAQLVYRRAKEISAVVYNFYTAANQVETLPSTNGTSPSATAITTAKENLIKQYPTLESLFGALDFCECQHCRSVLSPAAYLVDILQFIDPDEHVWNSITRNWQERRGTTYSDSYQHPYDALVARRPDIPHLPLTCENTHTELPYIDIVNEVLEYFIAKGGLDEKAAKDTGTTASATLLAEPQNVLPAAYQSLQQAVFPLHLPFDFPLSTLRAFMDYFELPYWKLLDTLRPTTALSAAETPGKAYYQTEVWMEYLGLSPKEYELFTRCDPTRWYELYGYTAASEATTETTDSQNQRIDLKSAKAMSRRLGITYKELLAVVRTAFVNPNIEAWETLKRLGLTLNEVLRYKGHAGFTPLSATEQTTFDQKLTSAVNTWVEKYYGTDGAITISDSEKTALSQNLLAGVKQWMDQTYSAGSFHNMLVLHDTDTQCNFDQTTLQYIDQRAATEVDYLKVNLLVRLWKKLGWKLTEVDRALQVFIPADNRPITGLNICEAFKTALIYLAHLKQLKEQSNLGKKETAQLLQLWSPLDLGGQQSLYYPFFIQKSLLPVHPVFDSLVGQYLQFYQAATSQFTSFNWDSTEAESLEKGNVGLQNHLLAIQGAFNLKSEEVTAILQHEGWELSTTPLSMDVLSTLYRYRVLADLVRLSITETIDLIALSGLAPFKPLATSTISTLAKDYPFTQTISFVELAQQIKASPFKVADLNYLFRHQFDPVGKYRLQKEAIQNIATTLATELSRITAENTPPNNLLEWTDEMISQQLALAFPAEIAATLMTMWTDSIEYQASKENVVVADQLTLDVSEEPKLRLSYDSTRQIQFVTYQGVLTTEQLSTLKGKFPDLADYLDDIQGQSAQFFTDFLAILLPVGLAPIDGFNQLFAIIPTNITKQAQQQRNIAKRQFLADMVLPYLRAQQEQQAITETLVAEFSTEVEIMEALLDNTEILVSPYQANVTLLEEIRHLKEAGLTLTHAAADGSLLDTKSTTQSIIDSYPAGVQSSTLATYFQVPASGAWRFFVQVEQADTTVQLHFAHQNTPLIELKTASANTEASEYLELQAGQWYQLNLQVANASGGTVKLLMQGEGMPKGEISRLATIPTQAISRFEGVYILLHKMTHLLDGLDLSLRELRYFHQYAADFANHDWKKLPVTSNIDAADSQTLLTYLQRMLNYTYLKAQLVGGTDEIIDWWESARKRLLKPVADSATEKTQLIDEFAEVIGTALRRTPTVVQMVMDDMEATVAERDDGNFTFLEIGEVLNEKGLQTLWNRLELVAKTGVAITNLRKTTQLVQTAVPFNTAFATAEDFKNAVKAQYSLENWQQRAASIFDPLRQMKRDALVAFIMHQQGFYAKEQLFEYFLLDPGMEPVVTASRLQLATASVQLFIQRCFLNLEKNVHPSVLRADHWQWKKRYRVWEANRKIFLYPENWLEPEFRDDKTHLFQELEGALLQGDVSKELVEKAFYTYLKQLEKIAKLNITCIYCEEHETDFASNTLHVLARTNNEPYEYFYRTYAHNMWTPWIPVTAQIEGQHLTMIKWRERLHLFWLTFLDKPDSSGDTNNKTAQVAASEDRLSDNIEHNIEIQLNWCEYFQGEWTTRESGGFNEPLRKELTKRFNPKAVYIYATKDYENGEESSVKINLRGGEINQAFELVNKISQPEVTNQMGLVNQTSLLDQNVLDFKETKRIGEKSLRVAFRERIENKKSREKTNEVILAKANRYQLVVCNTPVGPADDEINELVSPFFFIDRRHTFYVQPELLEKTIEEWEEWIIPPAKPNPQWVPDKWWDDLQIEPFFPYLPNVVDPLGPLINPADFSILYGIRERLDWVVNPGMLVQFDERVIGQNGGFTLDTRLAPTLNQTGQIVNIRPGSSVTSGSGVVQPPAGVGNIGNTQIGSIISEQGVEDIVIIGNDGLNLPPNILNTNIFNQGGGFGRF